MITARQGFRHVVRRVLRLDRRANSIHRRVEWHPLQIKISHPDVLFVMPLIFKQTAGFKFGEKLFVVHCEQRLLLENEII